MNKKRIFMRKIYIYLLSLVCLFFLGCSNSIFKELITQYTFPIKSLQTTITTQGSFFLGSGNIYGEGFYYVNIKLDEKKYLLVSIPSSRTIIEQSTSKSPQLIVDCSNIMWFYKKDLNNCLEKNDYFHYFSFCNNLSTITYILIVPENTIYQEFVNKI